MEFNDVRRRMRELLVAYHMGKCVEGPQVEAWLLEWGGWFSDPQEMYGDGTTRPLDQGIDAPCSNPDQGVYDAEWLLKLNGGPTSFG